jgi:hypothetical protein
MHAVLRSAFDELAAELARFDAMSANVHPRGFEHCWTARQVVHHLILSMDVTRKELEGWLAKGKLPKHAHRTRAEWALQLLVLSAGHMPRGVPAPPETTPPEQDGLAGVNDLRASLENATEMLDTTLDRCRTRFGMERVGRHFLLGPLRVDQWRRYHVLHMRHHLRQIVEARRCIPVEMRPSTRMARVS